MERVAPAFFLLGVIGTLYVLILYPLLLAVVSRREKKVSKGAITPTVSVILPVHNGERSIGKKLATLGELDYPKTLIQTIVISDGSTDQTAEIVRGWTDYPVELIEVQRGGKAKALNAGLARATGDILFFTDVRQPLDPNSLQEMISCFADPGVGVVSGELVILDSEKGGEASVGLYWKYEKWIRRRLSRVDSVMGATGAIYCMRRSLARPLPDETLLDDVYLPLLAFFAGYRVVFEEQALAYDYPTALGTEFVRKVRTQAGVYQLLRYFPQLLGPGNRMWIHFVSHKLGRLLLPFFVVSASVSSFWLPSPWAAIAITAQAALWIPALVDSAAPEGSFVKRITSPARTFVVLIAAAAAATSIWFRPSGSFWRQATVTPNEGAGISRSDR